MSYDKDILNQMVVTAANGEKIMFFDLREKAERDGKREEYEASRLDNLMRLGVKEHDDGPMTITGFSVDIVRDATT